MLVRANEVMPKRDRSALIETYDVERVLANIDADDGDCGVELLGHGVLLVFGAPCQRNLREGQAHGRTIPLSVSAASSELRLRFNHEPHIVPESMSWSR